MISDSEWLRPRINQSIQSQELESTRFSPRDYSCFSAGMESANRFAKRLETSKIHSNQEEFHSPGEVYLIVCGTATDYEEFQLR